MADLILVLERRDRNEQAAIHRPREWMAARLAVLQLTARKPVNLE
jgi:hypothetical protein